MKHLAKKRLLWASAAVGLLVLCKFVIYDTYIRCQQDFNSQEVRIETPTSTSAPPNENSIALIHRNYDFQLSIVSNLFEPTIRSCLGSKCFDMPAKTVDRVGLLAPQSSGAEVIYRIIKKANFNINSENFQFILDSHVPAYGYGKNHGWSRIIRIVRSPILQALQLLHTSQRFHSAEAPSLLESQVRQLVRWHCRLSHVAAHTRMLTGTLD